MSGCNRIHEFNRMYYILYFCEYQCPQLLISDSPQNAFLTVLSPEKDLQFFETTVYAKGQVHLFEGHPGKRSTLDFPGRHCELSGSRLSSQIPKFTLRFSVSRHSPQCRSQWPSETTVSTTTNGWVGLIGSKSGKPPPSASHGSHGTFTLGRFRRVEAEAPSLGNHQGSLKKRWKVKRLIATVHLFNLFLYYHFIYIYIER